MLSRTNLGLFLKQRIMLPLSERGEGWRTYRVLPMEVEGDWRVVYYTNLVEVPAEDGEVFDVVALEAEARLPEETVLKVP